MKSVKIINRLIQQVNSVIDKFNDRFSMYRLVLYFLLSLFAWTLIGSLAGQIPYGTTSMIFSLGVLVLGTYLVNLLLSKIFNIPANKESYLITALILFFIMTPASKSTDYALLAFSAVAAIASKYLIVAHRSHIFNPAAFGATAAGMIFGTNASWWIGTKFTFPLIAVGGILILRKVKRFSLAAVFCSIYVLALIWSAPNGSSTDSIQHSVVVGILSTSLIFFSAIMLTEPLTSPLTNNKTLIYAVLTGVFYSFNKLHISPEQALLIGNLFTFTFATNRRYKLEYAGKTNDAQGIVSYYFSPTERFAFTPGQYMEWTIAQKKSDSRGNRRYLTIASSPTEPQVMISVKIPASPSAFKTQLNSMKKGDYILASQLSGHFTLPKNPSKKLAFIAGGIGVTPFRSMIKHIIDTNQPRDCNLIYSANRNEEFAFTDIFSQAQKAGVKPAYTNQVTSEVIVKQIPDYRERMFYISGPYGFVNAVETALWKLGIDPANVITDYFPGYGA